MDERDGIKTEQKRKQTGGNNIWTKMQQKDGWKKMQENETKSQKGTELGKLWHPPGCNDVVLISFMETLCIKRVMIMKPPSTSNSKPEDSLGHEWVSVLCQLVRVASPQIIRSSEISRVLQRGRTRSSNLY